MRESPEVQGSDLFEGLTSALFYTALRWTRKSSPGEECITISWPMDRGRWQFHYEHCRIERFSEPVIPAQAGIQDFVMHPLESFPFHLFIGFLAATLLSNSVFVDSAYYAFVRICW
jgi:hypothetical protein